MKKLLYLYFAAFLLIFYSNAYSQKTNLNANTNELVELTFNSSIAYNNPCADITIECLVFKQSDSIRILGFWDGNNVYKIRFSLPTSGEWNFITYCSDYANMELHNQTGKITVSNYNGNNILYKKGPVKVSQNKTHLVYNNGEPFFYLGDTGWEITWKSLKEEVYQYISDRKNKGFTTLQIVALSHQFLWNYGVMNRYNETSFLNDNYFNINPKYFQYLDFIVSTANDSGLVVALVPLWAYFSEVHTDYIAHYLNIEQAFSFAKYLGARYSGFQIIWIIAGDNFYYEQKQKEFWSSFANIIKKSNGNTQLCTCHASYSSFDAFDNNEPRLESWLDFHMYQSSHIASGYITYQEAAKGLHLNTPKPLLNGEAAYEDIYSAFWLHDNNPAFTSFRIRPIDVRQASYESILNGARVGITYGGNGVWQWHIKIDGPHLPELDGNRFSPRFTVLEAIKMPGSGNMTILKNIMEKYKWYNFIPRQEYINSFLSKEKFIPISENDDIGIIYIPKNTSFVSLNAYHFNNHFAYYINPSTGDSISKGYISSTEKIIPLDTLDWILIIDKNDDYKGEHKVPDNLKTFNENIKFSVPFPNPFNTETTIMFYINNPCFISIKIYNALGKEIFSSGNKYFNLGYQYFTWPARNNSSGAYFYRIESDNHSASGKMVLLK